MITRMKSAHALAGRKIGSDGMRVSAVVIASRPCLRFSSLSTATAYEATFTASPQPGHIRPLADPDSVGRMDEHSKLTRRESLVAAGGLVAAALLPAAAEAGSGPAAVSSGVVSCVLSPELTQGPYYVPGEKLRRNITEGKPGRPLELRLSVVDTSTCKPIKGAAVDIWHADAGGVYSGAIAGNAGTNFLRGVQRTDAAGLVVFKTIYPGWYQGRAVHIHVMVHVGGNIVHTGQFFFSDTLTDAVYRRAPYSARPNRDTRNAADAIYRNGGSRSLLKPKASGTGYVAAIAMGVHRS